MSKQSSNPISSLTGTEILLYLIIIPFAFTATLHIISSQSEEIILSENTRFKADLSAARVYLLDMEKMRHHFLFSTTDDKYTKFANTNHHFNYTLPVLGERLMKVIRTKEEVSFNEETDKIETVDFYLTQFKYILWVDEFELLYFFRFSQKKNQPHINLETSLEVFCRNTRTNAICRLFGDYFRSHLKELSANVVAGIQTLK